MALHPDANYNQVVVQFDPFTSGIMHIKARLAKPNPDNPDETLLTEHGIVDRFSMDNGNLLPGIYNPGPYDPNAPNAPNPLDIDKCIRKVRVRREYQKSNPVDQFSTVGAALIYKFEDKNEVDVTALNLSDGRPYEFFMLTDPIHSEIRRRESSFLQVSTRSEPVSVENICVVGTLRPVEEE